MKVDCIEMTFYGFIYAIPGLNFDDHSNYHELMVTIIDTAVKMRDVFKQYL